MRAAASHGFKFEVEVENDVAAVKSYADGLIWLRDTHHVVSASPTEPCISRLVVRCRRPALGLAAGAGNASPSRCGAEVRPSGLDASGP